MRFSTSLICVATVTTFASAGNWTGSDNFFPKRNAEVMLLADATTSKDVQNYVMVPVREDIVDLFEAYKTAGLSLKVGYASTGAQNGKCWRPEMDMTDDVAVVRAGLIGHITDYEEKTMTPAFWNMMLSVTDSDIFTKDAPIRRVIVVMSEKTPEWEASSKWAGISLSNCNNSAPSRPQFRSMMHRHEVGLLYSSENGAHSGTEKVAEKITELLTATTMTDYKVVHLSSYPESGRPGKSIIPALSEMLSEDWIKSKTLEIWPGVIDFAPKQSAEVIFLVDATTTNHIMGYAFKPVKWSVVHLLDAYKQAGLTINVGLHLTGAQQGRCWDPRLELTDDVAALKPRLGGTFTNATEAGMAPNFWNTVLYLAESGKFTRDNQVRKVVVLMSERSPGWGSEITQPDMSPIECGHPSPPAEQFKEVMEKNGVALIYSAENMYVESTVTNAAKVTEILSATGLSDWKVVSQSTYATGGFSGRSIMPALAEVLSSEWIATTTTTLSPVDKFAQCIEQCLPCSN